MLDKDEFPDYMQSFPSELSEDLKQDLNRHIDMIIKQKCKGEIPTQSDKDTTTQSQEDDRREVLTNQQTLDSDVSEPHERKLQILPEENKPQIIMNQMKGMRSTQPK